MNRSNIFKDRQLNERLWIEGFVNIPFLDQQTIVSLLQSAKEILPKDLDHFFATTHLRNIDIRKQSRTIILDAIVKSSQDYFDQGQPLGGAFIAKPPNGKGKLSLHQDWNIVDETKYRSYNIWIPLVDTSEENGAFYVLPRSHKQEFTIRGPGIPEIWNDLEDTIYPKMKCLPMKAGEALIYDHALWHFSPPNQSSEPRPAIVMGMISRGTPMRAYIQVNGTIEEYESSEDYFFNEVDVSKPTTLKKLGNVSHTNPLLTLEKFHQMYLSENTNQDQVTSTESSNRVHDVGRFYDEQTGNFLKVYGQVIQAFRTRNVTDLLDYQIEAMGLKDGQYVLDAGCGVCGPARHFAKKRKLNIEAITISEKQAEMARQYVSNEGLDEQIDVKVGDFHNLSTHFDSNTFDVAYFLESFGHAVDHKTVIKECWKVLKPGGILYIKDLFIKEGIYEGHDEQIKKEIDNINRAYRYNVADLYHVLGHLRKRGFIINALKTIDLPLEQFENLTISNDFQELTGINKIDSLGDYIFPVDFFELKCQKPWNSLETGNSRYFLQNHYYMQVHGKTEDEL